MIAILMAAITLATTNLCASDCDPWRFDPRWKRSQIVRPDIECKQVRTRLVCREIPSIRRFL